MPYLTAQVPQCTDQIYLVVLTNDYGHASHAFLIETADNDTARSIGVYQYGKMTGLDSADITARITAYDDLPEIMFGESGDN